MKPKLLWIIAALLLAGFLYVQALIRIQIDMHFEWIYVAFEVFAGFIMIVGISSGVGALIAIIPFRKKEYKQKFRWTLPL
jgi:hypothetical protein